MNDTTTPLDLDAIERRANAATPGPWAMWDGYGPTSDGLMGVYRFGPADGTHVVEDGEGSNALYARREDWEFIATAREDIPALVAEVRKLRARFRLCGGCDATLARCNEHIEAGAIKCCPDCQHPARP